MGADRLILVVVAHARHQQLICTALSRAGFEATAVGSGYEAVLKMRDRKPRAILMDLDLPGGEGVALLELVKSDPKAGKIPVVAMVATEESDLSREAYQHGVDLLLPKPLRLQEMVAGLNRVIGEEIGRLPEAVKKTRQVRTSFTKTKEVEILQAPLGPPGGIKAKSGSQGSVLLVDDEIDQLRPVRIGLMRAGYKVLTARDGEEGIAKMQAAQPEVVVLDLEMPGMNGFDFLKAVKGREKEANVPVIVLTGRGDYRSMVVSYELGSDLFLNKPVSILDLVDSIQRVRRKASTGKRKSRKGRRPPGPKKSPQDRKPPRG